MGTKISQMLYALTGAIRRLSMYDDLVEVSVFDKGAYQTRSATPYDIAVTAAPFRVPVQYQSCADKNSPARVVGIFFDLHDLWTQNSDLDQYFNETSGTYPDSRIHSVCINYAISFKEADVPEFNGWGGTVTGTLLWDGMQQTWWFSAQDSTGESSGGLLMMADNPDPRPTYTPGNHWVPWPYSSSINGSQVTINFSYPTDQTAPACVIAYGYADVVVSPYQDVGGGGGA